MTRRAAEHLFLTEAEIAARLPMPTEAWQAAAAVLERDGLPRRDPLFGDRRCWPAVRDFLLARAGGGGKVGRSPAPAPAATTENLDVFRTGGTTRQRRPRPEATQGMSQVRREKSRHESR